MTVCTQHATTHLVIGHRMFPPHSRNDSETSMVQYKKIPDIFKVKRGQISQRWRRILKTMALYTTPFGESRMSRRCYECFRFAKADLGFAILWIVTQKPNSPKINKVGLYIQKKIDLYPSSRLDCLTWIGLIVHAKRRHLHNETLRVLSTYIEGNDAFIRVYSARSLRS